MIDRENELAQLQQAADSPPRLVILRGRRRVGKSFLLDRSLAERRGVFFQADEQSEQAHLDLLAREAARLLPSNPPLRFDDWDAALRFLGDQAAQAPLVVVLDEFQWLWQAQPFLDSIVQRHWDSWERAGTPITLILSGSALTMMEKLLDHSSPLFGRAQYRPLLLPLDFRQAAEFAGPKLSAQEKLERYAVLGGVPQYQVWGGRGYVRDVIADRILVKDQALHEEPLHLVRAEQQIRDPGTYFAMVSAIAHGATRPSEIANRTGLELPNLLKMLSRLAELGYVELRHPISVRPENKRSVYRLCDPFFRFWFRFVFPNRSLLARGRVQEVLATIERDFDTFMGGAFEDCCREWVGRYATSEQAPSCEELGAWWSRDGQVEIDITGMTRSSYVLLGSCKWNQQAPAQVVGKLLEHRDFLGARAGRAKLMIFARGFAPQLVERARDEDVTLISAEALFA